MDTTDNSFFFVEEEDQFQFSVSLHEHWGLGKSKSYSPCSSISAVAFLHSQHPPLQGRQLPTVTLQQLTHSTAEPLQVNPVLQTTLNLPP